MKNVIRRDLLKIYSRVVEILEEREEKDFGELKDMSDMILQNSSIFQDDDSISAAVIVYSLAKLIDRGITDMQYDMLFTRLVSAMEFLETGDKSNYRKKIKEIFKLIDEIDKKLRLYLGDVISQAEMKKAGSIYRHGISVGIVSELMGISQWELLNYLGKTAVAEHAYDPKDIRKRLAFARSLFMKT